MGSKTGEVARVFVFGLDAASPTLIERWADDLPTLSRLIAEGTWGELQSTIPPFTSPAWACMATGKNPAKVGIFGLRHRATNSYELVPPTAAHRRAPAMWEIAGQAGRRVVVFNVPDTYPPTEVNGVMVSGRPAPVDPGAPITYPRGLRAEIDRAVDGYLVGPSVAFDKASRHSELPTWEMVLQRQQAALEYLLDRMPWDLCFSVSMAIDGISHHFWKYTDSQHPEYDAEDAQRFGDVLRRIYQLEDQRLERILQRLTPEDLLLVVSDHGSTPCYRHIAVNRWLLDNGYLVLEEDVGTNSQSVLGPVSQLVFRLYRRSDWIRRLARPLRRSVVRDIIVAAHFAMETGGRVPLDALQIDWTRTTAYYLGDDRLYLNVAGREPQGAVQPGAEYLRLREELRTKLAAARDPETGYSLFAAVHTRDEIYAGPCLDQAPDLILIPGDVHWSLGGSVGDVVVDKPDVSGKHHPEGVFVIWGQGVRANLESPASIYDIAPTILHAMGLPVPGDSDGEVRLDWFTPEAPVAQRLVKTTTFEKVHRDEYQWAPEEQAQVESRLRDLGYFD